MRRLERWDDALEKEEGRTGNPASKWPLLSDPEPHKIPASNLAQSGEHKYPTRDRQTYESVPSLPMSDLLDLNPVRTFLHNLQRGMLDFPLVS